MALTASQHLELVDLAIQGQFTDELFTEYEEMGNRFKRLPITELYKIRQNLMAEMAATGASGSQFRLAEPFDE